ncbi:MAG: hypothetical protein WC707_04865 [Candidatus Babeliaceae bacterium]|jgi:hypothetical protein
MKKLFLLFLLQSFVLLSMDDQLEASSRIENLRALILKSDHKSIEILLKTVNRDVSKADVVAEKRNLMHLAVEVLAMRTEQEAQLTRSQLILRVLHVPCVVLKTVFDIFDVMGSNNSQQLTISSMNLAFDAAVIGSAGYNVYKLLGSENVCTKKRDAKNVVQQLKNIL